MAEYFFPNSKLDIFDIFLTIFNKIPNFSKKFQGPSLKARGLIEDISNEKENIIFQNY